MTADLRLVMHAAQADADELAAHGAGDGLAERGLAHPRRPDEAEDRRLALGGEFADGQIFDDPLLDLLQAIVVLVEDAARLGDIDGGGRRRRPGQLHQPVEIGADHAVFGRRVGRAAKAAQFLAGLRLDLGGHLGLVDRGAQFLDVGGRRVTLAELLLDGRQLFAQQPLALALAQGGVGLAADLRGKAQHVQPLGQDGRDLVQARLEVERFEYALLFLRLGVHIGGGQVGQGPGGGNVGHGRAQIGRRLGDQI